MASPELVSVLDEGEGIVELWPATEVVDLDRLPGDEAELLVRGGWRSAYFKAGAGQESQAMRARLTLGKPMGSVMLDSQLGLLSHDIRGQALKSVNEGILGGKGEDGFTRLPALLAVINGPGGISLVACPGGTGCLDYWAGRPAATEGNTAVADTAGLLSPEETAAIEGVYMSLAVASHELLNEAGVSVTSFAGG